MPYSDSFLKNIYSRSSGDPSIVLIEVNIDGTFYYYANNTQSIDSNVSGSTQTYQPVRFDLSLPEETAEGTPRATIDFDAADISTVIRLRLANDRIIINLWVIAASAPNIAEFGPAQFETTSFIISGSGVSVDLEVEPILDVQLPGERFTPQTFPALWEDNDS